MRVRSVGNGRNGTWDRERRKFSTGLDSDFNNAGHSEVGPTDAPWFIDGVREMFDVDFLGTVRVIIHPALTQTPLLANVRPEDMPPAFRRLSPIPAEQVAEAAVHGISRRALRIVVPWQPRFLMLAQALSPRLGDFFLALVQTRLFGRVFRTFRGVTYQHSGS